MDTGANIFVTNDSKLRDSFVNLQELAGDEVILMNAHPEPVACRGSLPLTLVCSKTGKPFKAFLEDCVYVPGSAWNIFSWTPWADQLFRKTGFEATLTAFRNAVSMSTGHGSSVVWGERVKDLLCLHSCKQARAYATEDGGLTPKKISSEGPWTEAKRTHKEESGGYLTGGGQEDVAGGGQGEAGKAVSLEQGARILASALVILRRLHANFSHASLSAIKSLIRAGRVKIGSAAERTAILGFGVQDLACEACATAAADWKHTASGERQREKEEGEWTIDASGPHPRSAMGNRYKTVVVAPNNKAVFVFCHRKKGYTLRFVKKNFKRWERLTGEKILFMGSDRGGENMGKLMSQFCDDHGIIQHFTSAGNSGGKAETYIGVIQDKARASLNQAGLTDWYWDEATNCAAAALDMMPCEPLKGISMYEHRTGRLPRLFDLHPFGSFAVATLAKKHQRKGQDRGIATIFLGPAMNGDAGFRVRGLQNNRLYNAAKVTVHPETFPRGPAAAARVLPLSFAKEGEGFSLIHPNADGVTASGLAVAAAPPAGPPGAAPSAPPPPALSAVAPEDNDSGLPPALPPRVRAAPYKYDGGPDFGVGQCQIAHEGGKHVSFDLSQRQRGVRYSAQVSHDVADDGEGRFTGGGKLRSGGTPSTEGEADLRRRLATGLLPV